MTELAYHDEDQPSNVIDFTAYKLQVCIDTYRRQGNEQAEAFEQALYLYLKGELAIEWIEGHPFAIVANADAARLLKSYGGISKEAFDDRHLSPANTPIISDYPEDVKENEEYEGEMTGIGEIDENENPNDSE